MRAVSVDIAGTATYGVAIDDRVHVVSGAFRARYGSLRATIAAGALHQLSDNVDASPLDVGDVRFLPPVPNPDKILCVGVNYRPHIEEMGREIPEHPVVFVRFPGSLAGHEEAILRPRVSSQFDFEGELAVIIGKPARHVRKDEALDYVAGYTCFMDGSVRDWQRHTMQFTPGKNFDRSGAMGPALVTADEIPDPTVLVLQTRVNGEVMQRGRLGELVFDIPSLIAYCSTFAQLLPGDVIATGTPGGVGAARKPPVWLTAGDRVEVEVDGVGVLSSPVWDETPTGTP